MRALVVEVAAHLNQSAASKALVIRPQICPVRLLLVSLPKYTLACGILGVVLYQFG